jgi:hypothetical protein
MFAVITPDFLFQPGDGYHQIRAYLVDQRDPLQLRPIMLTAG